MTTFQILTVIGLPSVFAALYGWIAYSLKRAAADNKALKLGVQALLRAQMITDYNKWTERGYAPIYARENFENCWREYHALGVNGVMDNLHDKFMELPTALPENMEVK